MVKTGCIFKDVCTGAGKPISCLLKGRLLARGHNHAPQLSCKCYSYLISLMLQLSRVKVLTLGACATTFLCLLCFSFLETPASVCQGQSLTLGAWAPTFLCLLSLPGGSPVVTVFSGGCCHDRTGPDPPQPKQSRPASVSVKITATASVYFVVQLSALILTDDHVAERSARQKARDKSNFSNFFWPEEIDTNFKLIGKSMFHSVTLPSGTCLVGVVQKALETQPCNAWLTLKLVYSKFC